MKGLEFIGTSARISVITGSTVTETEYAVRMFEGETVYVVQSVYTIGDTTVTRYAARYQDDSVFGMPCESIGGALNTLKK